MFKLLGTILTGFTLVASYWLMLIGACDNLTPTDEHIWAISITCGVVEVMHVHETAAPGHLLVAHSINVEDKEPGTCWRCAPMWPVVPSKADKFLGFGYHSFLQRNLGRVMDARAVALPIWPVPALLILAIILGKRRVPLGPGFPAQKPPAITEAATGK